MRGRPRKPTETLKLFGTYRADRHAGRAEPLAEGAPERPDDLAGDAALLWDFVVAELTLNGTAKRIDTPLLYTLCQTWALYRKALVLADKDPIDKDNRIAVTSYLAAFNQIGGKFGLSPSDRARLQIEGAQASPASELADFLAGQNELDQVGGG